MLQKPAEPKQLQTLDLVNEEVLSNVLSEGADAAMGCQWPQIIEGIGIDHLNNEIDARHNLSTIFGSRRPEFFVTLRRRKFSFL